MGTRTSPLLDKVNLIAFELLTADEDIDGGILFEETESHMVGQDEAVVRSRGYRGLRGSGRRCYNMR
jgi:hypothetical protein